MKLRCGTILAAALALAVHGALGGEAVDGAKCKSGAGAAARPVPRPAMAERLANGPEIIGIVHWGLNTYTDREWGYGDEDPALLNPAKFDADQIVGACKAGGIGGLVVVAKHHDGFCLWPTKTTGHNITKSPFGRDYVKEMEQACRRAGIKFGVYCSPWDRNSVHYATDKYVEIFHAQLKELLGGAYGDVFEMWFDGANGGDGYYGGAREKRRIGAGYYRFDEVFRFVREMQSGVTIFSGSEDGSDLRWCGNERGVIDAGSRATIAGTGGYRDGKYGNPDYVSIRNVGSSDGEFFRVAEADFPLRKGWFYHEKERGTTKSAAYLTKLYLSSVGNAGVMDIGIAPNKDGLLDADDVKALAGFKALKDALFAHEVATGGSQLVATASEPFNVVVMREDISRGEQVDEWEFVADGAAILHGKSIGAKRVRVLETPCVAKCCKVNVLKDGGEFQGVSFKLYRADPELVRLVLSATTESGETDTAKWMTAAEASVEVSVGEREFKTYPFSDPDPVPATSERRYPYFRYDGSTDVPEQRVWKTVTLESDRLAVTILPEVGGKVWGAYDKVAKRDFLYANHVMKFRDIAMRGPWTSGGIEFNFGVIGHSPCTSTPVDWHVRTNGDGSASCFVGGMEYITRSFWQVEVVLKGGADEFETRTVWYNASGTPAPYYQWMNAAYSLRDDPEFLFDGKSAVGHGGEILTRTWPIDAKGRDVSLYRNNCYGGPKSLHFVGGDGGFYGIWWRDLGYGSWHRSLPYEKYGRKLFIWALSREGGIWEDLLTDGDGQYAELQSGRCFNQPRRGNVYSPFKHPTFAPGTAETFADRWGPLRSREEAKSDAAAPKPRPIDPAPGIDWSSPRAQAVLGIQALRTRDDCKGEDMLKSALAKDGTIVEAMLGLAELAYRRGQYARVHELAEKAMSFDLYDREANYLDGAAYFAEGDMPSARERLGVAAFSGGWRAAAMAMIARSFLREGDMHAALAAAEEALRSEGLQMDALLAKAVALRGTSGREAFLADVLRRLPLAHQFRYELEGLDAMRRAVGCELPHETFLEIGSWYEETGLAEDARRIFRLALPNPVAEMRLAFIERRPPILAMKVEGAFPFRRESRPALEAVAATGGWKAQYFLAVLKGFFRETEESSALLESCGDEPDESVFYLYRARTREGKRRMDDLLRARATGDSWRVGRDIMEAHEKSGDMAQMLSTAEEYLRRFPSKNPLQIGYARALMKLGRHAECMEYLKGVKILPSEHRDSATGIWHECQKALGLQPTWPENLGQGEPYHDGECRQTE